jgi:uncharacterized protein YihD (DUF1040 family)
MEKTNKTEKISETLEKASQTMAQTLVEVIDKLAGKESDLKLSFEDLSLDAGVFKAKMNGSIVLSVVVAKEAAESSSKATKSATRHSST